MSKSLKRLFGFLFSIYFYLAFPCAILLVLVTPLMAIDYIQDVAKYETPRLSMTPILFVLSGMLYLSIRVPRLRKIYEWIPVLMPALQMGFIMTVVTSLGLSIMNVWAEDHLYPKSVAVIGAVLCILLGRAFMSYWYYKYPVSAKLRRS